MILLINYIQLYEKLININDLNYIIANINYSEYGKNILYFTNSKLNCHSKFKNKKLKKMNISNTEENNKNINYIGASYIFN